MCGEKNDVKDIFNWARLDYPAPERPRPETPTVSQTSSLKTSVFLSILLIYPLKSLSFHLFSYFVIILLQYQCVNF